MISRLPRPRSLQNKLALLIVGITALAFAAVIFVVLPRLEAQIETQQLDDVRRSAAVSSRELQSVIGQNVTAKTLDLKVRAAADAAGARVTLLGVQQSTSGGPQFFVLSDSNANPKVKPDVRLAGRAALARSPSESVSVRKGSARVAKPLFYRGRPAWIALYTRKYDEVREAVELVRTRLLVAGFVALLIALVGGFLGASTVARRVRRLEVAARDVAAGRPVPPLPVDSSDELGELTRTFNEMQRQLARVDNARKEFIANASHELRTPIFSLAGFVELLEDEELDAETRAQFLATMRGQVERLQKLAVDLLDLSRLDAGSIELVREEVDLGELTNAVAGEFRPALRQHRTKLEVDLPDAPVAAACDRERVVQIMRILLDNAIRHTPEGTGVTVTAAAENGAAELVVADSGPGIDPAARTHVFERFYTGDAARGSGLGLAIARELAARMDGSIELESRPGRTAFTLSLPAGPHGGQAA
ncbi:MAG TPA: HAMP domain-containing sensor histidine kinase [Thermoleophilaceae bacterium]|jgi:signal transduction histidine kinase